MRTGRNRNLVVAILALFPIVPTLSAQRTIQADVVALDQAFYNNRLGAFQPGGMIFALRGDVVSNVPGSSELVAGQVMLRPDKRPRPMVLRMNVGDCMQVNFQNLLAPVPSIATVTSLPFQPKDLKTHNDPNPVPPATSANDTEYSQPATRMAGVHVMGTETKEIIEDDASWVGRNSNSLAKPGETKTYKFCAVAEGAFLLYSTGADLGYADVFGGQLTQGLFGSLIVEPPTAEWYRSQVTRADLDQATYNAGALPSGMTLTPKGSPQETFTSSGKTYKVWTLKRTGAGGFTTEVTQTNLAGDPVSSGGLLKTRTLHPLINYQAKYANGKPILSMLDGNKIISSDLTAVITGPNAGRFHSDNPSPAFKLNPVYPDRFQPYREFTIHYHDDPTATQAFPEFGPLPSGQSCPSSVNPADCGVTFALQAARDFFAINYGMAAIGPEVWANRTKVGPMAECATCKFEEFFLSSWAVSDPAMVVDFPANNHYGDSANHVAATKALFPDDPSNVYHSYMGDHVQFRILHAGTNITHVHHQHAHQWLHSPNSDESDYRDSQMLSPGGSYTLDMSYYGSGNLNQTVGDAIFHCHFYPHFAQGMWSLWRVHDVFEAGTVLDSDGIPVPDWNRALPDGEIPNGTPIPAVVPMPTLAMAPIPIKTRVCAVYDAGDYVQFTGDSCPAAPAGKKPVGYKGMASAKDIADPSLIEKNPGYPFFVPGIAGQRAPHPPLDFAPDEDGQGNPVVIAGQKQYLDGGLPRSQFLEEQGKEYEKHNAYDFTKEDDKLLGVELDEEGTNLEKIAMAAHSVRKHPSETPEGQPATFILNGQAPKPGAPFADPAIDLNGDAIPNSDCQKKQPGCVRYKAADIQMNVVLNKKGWHYPQQRILSLWGDVRSNLGLDDKNPQPRPEPLFFRANSDQVVEYWLANLVPTVYELDDFQVRTPTDIIGQHIHLVKFDVLASDGAGNGFNYEDGTFSNEEVVALIASANKDGGLYSVDGTRRNLLKAKEIPYFAQQFPGKFPGAQATIQRWYADPIKDNAGQDRTMRTVFTHDHFGPSTHQQVGLYAGLVVEPKGSKWFNSTTGEALGGRADGDYDGGPTTYQANINLEDPAKSYREFLLEFQDRQLAYLATSISTPKPYVHYGGPGQPSSPGGFWGWADPTNAINPPSTPNEALIPAGPPYPDLVTNQFSEGAYSLSYTNEPLSYRVVGGSAKQEDLASAFVSMTRADSDLNRQPAAGTPINPANPGGFKFALPQVGSEDNDPYTPLLRAYEGDNVQIRNLVGAHMAPHSFHIHGLNWLFEPSVDSSGFRSTQGMGISEHYEFLFQLPLTAQANRSDYLYIPTSDPNGVQYGNWGLIRGYKQKQGDLIALSETQKKAFPGGKPVPPAGSVADVCKPGAPVKHFDVTAILAANALPGKALVYNARGGATAGQGPITDPFAMMYVLNSDLENGILKAGVPQEPLILRADAGDCITVSLTNALPAVGGEPLNAGLLALPQIGSLSQKKIQTSHSVGLHPQLLAYDVTTSDGFNIGSNATPETAAPRGTVQYRWYAGRVGRDSYGKPTYTPVEFGAVNLAPADPLMQDNFGLIGALIIEPKGSIAKVNDKFSRAQANITDASGKLLFREGVAIVQDDLAYVSVPAFNYRTEPISYRYVVKDPPYLTNDPALSPLGISRAQSDTLVSADPQTPIFVAQAGVPLRLRVLHPAGEFEEVFELHGHAWQEEPYSKGSLNFVNDNPLSQWTGSRDTFGANSAFDVILKQAGGSNAVQGDYLFRTFIGKDFQNGLWGLVRVGAPNKDVVTTTTYCSTTSQAIAGNTTVNPANNEMASTVTITGSGLNIPPLPVNPSSGQWSYSGTLPSTLPQITVASSQGGTQVVTPGPDYCAIQSQPAPPVNPSTLKAPKADDVDRFRPEPATLPK